MADEFINYSFADSVPSHPVQSFFFSLFAKSA